MSVVWLAAVRSRDSAEHQWAAIDALWDAAGFNEVFGRNDLTAIKLHVGEPGTKTFASPILAAALVRHLTNLGAKPFLTDTSVLYKSRRDNGVDHAHVAAEHGFGIESVGAPFIPADGLLGSDELEIEFKGRHFDRIAIAAGIMQARSMLVLSHATGHLGTGYGGALKNLGMGCCSKKAKLRQHHGHQPRIDCDICVACGDCADWCPAEAIEVESEGAVIEDGKCIGCGECVAVCREAAVSFDWSIMGQELQERIVEHAAGLIGRKPGRITYITVAMDITQDCDCMGQDQPPLLEDIGIFASHDPVAIDQAVMDQIRKHSGQTIEAMSYPSRDPNVQTCYAEELGIGEREYELIPVSVG